MSAHRCDGYTLFRPEFMGVRFCRKAGAQAAQEVLDQRDALRERVDALEQQVADLEHQRDALRAQNEAARAECRRIHDVHPQQDAWGAAADVLRAMDEAKS